MPTQSYYDKEAKLIHHRYWGNMTIDECLESLSGEKEFFNGMSGLVGAIFDMEELHNVPPTILTYATKAQFAQYRPILIAMVKPSGFIGAMAQIFSQLSGASVVTYKTLAEAEAAVKAQQGGARAFVR